MPRLYGFTPAEQRQEIRPTAYGYKPEYQGEPVYQPIGAEGLPPNERPLDGLINLMRTMDWMTGAPARAGLAKYIEAVKHKSTFPELQAMKALAKAFTKPPEESPTGKDIASSLGMSSLSLKRAAEKAGYDPGYYPDISPAGMAGALVEGVANLPTPGLAAMGMMGKAPRMAKGMAGTLGKKVYHGSPHRFDKFSLSKIGTGEGRQVFGHGLYFADNPNIAKEYAEALGDPTLIKEWRLMNHEMSDIIPRIDKTAEKYNVSTDEINEYFRNIEKMNETSQNPNKYIEDLNINDEIKKELREFSNMDKKMADFERDNSSKHFYTARIPEGDYLKWDEPLSKAQKKKIKPLIEQAKKSFPNLKEDDLTASAFYKLYSDHRGGNPQEASKALNALGIQGIDYPAGTFSGVESKARNYVVFSDEGISIEDIKKLMLLGAGAGVGAVAYTGKQ